MKEFNLDAALNGEPVVLRSGRKAYIGHKTPDCYVCDSGEKIEFPLHGYIIKADNIIEVPNMFWTINGRAYKDNVDNASDIVGMWEEPKLTSEQVLEKAYEDDLLVLCDGNPDLPLKVIAKAKNGEFVMQPEDDTIQPWLANLTMEWFFVKDSAPKSNTITVTLPKPFKAKKGDNFWFIVEDFEI
ncbi:TPA: hypothetical protein ACXK87_001311 [Haemophilus influenzae]